MVPASPESKSDLHQASSGYSFPFLDGLRGIAILSVVLCHMRRLPRETTLEKIIGACMFAGSMGVFIFFVLSGFLISMAVFAIHTRSDLLGYLLRRAGKILPPFYLTLGVLGVIYIVLGIRVNDVIKANLAYVTTYANFSPRFAWYDPPCWTLFIEMHFYLLLPLVLLFLRRITRHTIFFTFLLFFLVPAMVRLGYHHPVDKGFYEWFFAYMEFPRCLDAFSLGILFTLIFVKYRSSDFMSKLAVPLSYAGLALLVINVGVAAYFRLQNEGLVKDNYLTIADIEVMRYLTGPATFLLLFMAFYPKGILITLFTFAPLQYAGLISYEWYLIHFPLLNLFEKAWGEGQGNLILFEAIYILVPLALASLMYHKYSKPSLERVKVYARSLPRG